MLSFESISVHSNKQILESEAARHKLVAYGQAVQATGVTPFVWCQLT